MRRLARHRRRVLAEGFAAARGGDAGVDDAALELVPHGRHVAELVQDPGGGLDGVVNVLAWSSLIFSRAILAVNG